MPDEISLPELDAGVLERMRAEHGPDWLGPVRSLPPEIGGTWAWTQEGQRVWRVTIRATGARALRVRFEGFSVQGSLWMYGDEWNGPHVGPYRDEGPQGDGSFWSAFVFAESVTVEYVPDDAASAPESVPFRIRSVAPIMDARFPVLGGRAKDRRSEDRGLQPRSLAGCHLDVSCYPDLQKRDQPSVAKLHITKPEGTFSCTGFLINPQYESDSRLLMLTAGHCIDSHEVASDVSFLWDWQTEQCYGDPDWKQWAEALAWTYGATLVVAKDDRYDDFALLVLNKADVTDVTGWSSKGWTTAELRTGDQVSTVSHPAGNYKRAAFGRVVNESWTGHSTLGFKTIQWRLGTTEQGSSGSPVLKWQDGQGISILRGCWS
ncbi:MAG: trypsin-like peptidase domain-containing protein [Bryobacterales bacterium]|nr:trypsin-like peptidase domain-containing protein [Bryobacterales bacterium]